jgi:crossover junction endodeoxyribonuclease RusA
VPSKRWTLKSGIERTARPERKESAMKRDGLNENALSILVTHLELPWPPTGNHATKHTRSGGHYKTREAALYRAIVRTEVYLLGLTCLPLVGPLEASWLLSPPDRRARDVDNVRKELADALTLAGFWLDDSCKVIRRERFEWTDPTPGGRVHLTVEVLQ